MNDELGLWVCPKCHVLQGIEVWVVDDTLKGRCVNCGVPIDPSDVRFLNIDMAQRVIEEIEKVVPEFLHDYIRYSWVSNETVGIIFEFPVSELTDEVDYDPYTYFEDVIGEQLGLTMTVFFEL